MFNRKIREHTKRYLGVYIGNLRSCSYEAYTNGITLSFKYDSFKDEKHGQIRKIIDATSNLV